jgi:hypothetical protein
MENDINKFKNIADSENFHYGNIYGIHYFDFGLHIYETIEKLTNQKNVSYWVENENTKIPISKDDFLREIKGI